MKTTISVILFSLVMATAALASSDVSIVTGSSEDASLYVADSIGQPNKTAIYGVTGGDYGAGVTGENTNGMSGTGVRGFGSDGGVYGFSTGLAGVVGDGYTGGYFYADVWATSVVEYSDSTGKRNIRELTPSLDKVMRLKPKTYELAPYIRRKMPLRENIGLLAQDVEQVFPELVSSISRPVLDDNGKPTKEPRLTHKGVRYTALVPVLIKAMQEQQEQIEAQRASIEALRMEIASLRK